MGCQVSHPHSAVAAASQSQVRSSPPGSEITIAVNIPAHQALEAAAAEDVAEHLTHMNGGVDDSDPLRIRVAEILQRLHSCSTQASATSQHNEPPRTPPIRDESTDQEMVLSYGPPVMALAEFAASMDSDSPPERSEELARLQAIVSTGLPQFNRGATASAGSSKCAMSDPSAGARRFVERDCAGSSEPRDPSLTLDSADIVDSNSQ